MGVERLVVEPGKKASGKGHARGRRAHAAAPTASPSAQRRIVGLPPTPDLRRMGLEKVDHEKAAKLLLPELTEPMRRRRGGAPWEGCPRQGERSPALWAYRVRWGGPRRCRDCGRNDSREGTPGRGRAAQRLLWAPAGRASLHCRHHGAQRGRAAAEGVLADAHCGTSALPRRVPKAARRCADGRLAPGARPARTRSFSS